MARRGEEGRRRSDELVVTESLDEALCHGWIDGTRRSRDDLTFLQRYGPRRARSTWSKRNVEHVTRLEADGRMHPAGRAEVERAKADGRWDAAYAGSADLSVPDDLLELRSNANLRALAMFQILTAQNRFSIVFRVEGAKRPETRMRRIEKYVDMLARGETIYPQRRTLADDAT